MPEKQAPSSPGTEWRATADLGEHGRVPPPSLDAVPTGRTAQRLEWVHLPPALRQVIEGRCGSPVATAVSQRSGFTPGFASVLVCEDGTRHFVKAASVKAQRPFAEAYREEARKTSALPTGVAATRLLWTHDADDWVVLGFEHVEARAPHRPWTDDDLAACLATLATTAERLTPVPAGFDVVAAAEEFAAWPALWERVLATFALPRGVEAAALAARHAEVGGDTLVHCDVRDDNLLITDAGEVLLCDWNWPVRGAAWLDSLMLLVGPRGDGLDVEQVLATHPTFAGVDPEAVDIVLALLTGYFLASSEQPVPSSSPYLREHQLWQGEACWEWLCERRGWPPEPDGTP